MFKKTILYISLFFVLLNYSSVFAAENILVSEESSTDTTAVLEEVQTSQDPSKIFPGTDSLVEQSATAETTIPSVPLPVEIQTLIDNNDLVSARSALLKLWTETTDPGLKDAAEIVLSDVNSKLLFSEEKFPGTIEYRVKPGDSLYVIAKKNKTSAHMIQMINGLKSDMIHPGQKLEVLPGNFSITVSKAHNILRLFWGNQLFKRYRCATGTTSDLTPEGTFTVTAKLENPTWFKMGSKAIPPGEADNLLGTRWIGISRQGYGIHGTTVPESIGKHATSGCVRMMNNEVEELYDMVPPGTKVTITA